MSEIDRAARDVASHYFGRKGVWAYECFDWINERLYDGNLPQPLILWGLTAHGGCLGFTMADPERVRPVIQLHPSLLGSTAENGAWGFGQDLLGPAFAFDTLIHECIHVWVEHILCRDHRDGTSSHNNPAWVKEINRVAPLLGITGLNAAMSKTKRVANPDRPRGKTRVIRTTDGNVPFEAVSGFPRSVRVLRGQSDYYRQPPVVSL